MCMNCILVKLFGIINVVKQVFLNGVGGIVSGYNIFENLFVFFNSLRVYYFCLVIVF